MNTKFIIFCTIILYSFIQFSLIYNFVHSLYTDHRTRKRVCTPLSLYSAVLGSLFHPFVCLDPVIQPNSSLPFKECMCCKPLFTYTTATRLMTLLDDNRHSLRLFDVKINTGLTYLLSEENLWNIISANCWEFYNEFTMFFCLILIQGTLCSLCLLY
jgi:hypothetical protein